MVHTPKEDEWRIQSTTNKQGSDDNMSDKTKGIVLTSLYEYTKISCQQAYESAVEAGVAREQARSIIPHGTYSSLYWQSDLKNLLHFLKLRLDPHAQQEIREMAEVMAGFVQELFPLVWEAFVDYELESVTMTKFDRQLSDWYDQEMFDGKSINGVKFEEQASEIGMSKRELTEFKDKMSIDDIGTHDYTLNLDDAIILAE